jgi:hypothetical protein
MGHRHDVLDPNRAGPGAAQLRQAPLAGTTAFRNSSGAVAGRLATGYAGTGGPSVVSADRSCDLGDARASAVSVGPAIRDDASDSPRRVFNISGTAGNEMTVRVKDRLTGHLAAIPPNVEPDRALGEQLLAKLSERAVRVPQFNAAKFEVVTAVLEGDDEAVSACHRVGILKYGHRAEHVRVVRDGEFAEAARVRRHRLIPTLDFTASTSVL